MIRKTHVPRLQAQLIAHPLSLTRKGILSSCLSMLSQQGKYTFSNVLFWPLTVETLECLLAEKFLVFWSYKKIEK